MPDPDPTPDPTPDPAPDPDPTPDPAPDPEPKGDKKPPWGSDEDFDPDKAWKLIQNVRSDAEKAKAEREELAKKVKAHEDATKSDTEKLEERATGAETKANEFEGKFLRLDVALEKAPEGMLLPQVRKLAKRLSGSNREELEADAEELFAEFAPDSDDDEKPRRRPTERLRPGAAPSAEAEPNDPAKLAEGVSRGW